MISNTNIKKGVTEETEVQQENEKCDRLGLTVKEKVKIGSVYGVLAAITVILIILAIYVGYKYALLAGLGLVSYIYGLQHAVDADHIAAIDNTTRKLLQQDKHPTTVGTWFSLGHSTIVLALFVALVFATEAIKGSIPGLQSGGNILGTWISGVFLFLIGTINALIVLGVYKTFKGLKNGTVKADQINDSINKNSMMGKAFSKLFKLVNEPWQIYPIGVLFGLGFDTATQVALFAIGTTLAVTNVPMVYYLVLPFLFTAGMVTIDTTDGVLMRCAYGWAFLKPIRKIFYNLTITIISVMVAFIIGGIEVTQVVSAELGLTTGFWGWLQNLDFGVIGYTIIGTFLISWTVAVAYYRHRGYEKMTFPNSTSDNAATSFPSH
jgi:high-affinity nickel-transport protein